MDAVIFDCDGVLIDSETIAHEVELEAVKRLGLFFDSAGDPSRFQGLAVAGWSAVLEEAYLLQHGVALPKGAVAEISAEITRRVLADIRPIKGAIEVVRLVRRPKAVASSSPGAELTGKIAGLGLADDFLGHVYSGDDVTHAKPAPDLFLLAAERLGVRAAHSLVIEDSVNGVKAGVAAGMTVWGFTGGPHCLAGQGDRLRQAGAMRVMENMHQIAAALGEI